MKRGLVLALGLLAGLPGVARAQQVDMTRGGPVEITASDGLEWHQNEQQVIARGNARAVRGNVTVTADRLIAYYRKKNTGPNAIPLPPPVAPPVRQPAATAPAAETPPAVGQPASPAQSTAGQGRRRAAMAGAAPGASSPPGQAAQSGQAGQGGLLDSADSGGNEIYRVEAVGNVHIFTPTDNVWGARAIYDMDQAVLLMTGGALRLTTPSQVLTARDSLEYWTDKRMAVARGNAVVVTNDAKRVTADTLVAFTKEDSAETRAAAPRPTGGRGRNQQPGGTPAGAQQPPGSGKLQRVEAFGHVSIQTPSELVTGDRGIYVADTGLARLGGNVRITRGENQLNGSDALVDMNTGVSRLLAGTTGRVTGLVVPNDPSNQGAADALQPQPGTPAKPAASVGGARRRAAPNAVQPQAAPAGTGTQP